MKQEETTRRGFGQENFLKLAIEDNSLCKLEHAEGQNDGLRKWFDCVARFLVGARRLDAF